MKRDFKDMRKNASNRNAFTLLEMVMVMAIIAVLAGGVIGLLGNLGSGAKLQRVGTDMQAITNAVMSYETLAGRVPTTEQGLEALVKKPTSSPKPKKYPAKGFMKSVPVDPWGNPYIYKMPGSKDSTTFELISWGEDGKAGGDDISSQGRIA